MFLSHCDYTTSQRVKKKKQNKTKQDETRRDETRRDGTGRDGTGRDKTKSGRKKVSEKVIFERPTDGAPAAHRRHSKSSARRANINFFFYSRDGLHQKGRIARSLHFDVFYDPLINNDAQ